jgi:hypothetical protein
VPDGRAPAAVPCGDLGGASAAGVVLLTHRDERSVLVDPLTGTVRARYNGVLSPVSRDLALESSLEPDPTGLALVDIATGPPLARLAEHPPLRL